MIGRDALIAGYACPRKSCGKGPGKVCVRKNGEPRVSQHVERWAAAGVTQEDLRKAAYERRAG